jgi:Ribbon-helix-helix protein, copG family
MSMKSIMVQLRADQIAQLDAEATRSGRSRAQVVRDAVDQILPTAFDQALADRYAKAYADGQSGTDEWGSLDDWHAAAAASRRTTSQKDNGWS